MSRSDSDLENPRAAMGKAAEGRCPRARGSARTPAERKEGKGHTLSVHPKRQQSQWARQATLDQMQSSRVMQWMLITKEGQKLSTSPGMINRTQSGQNGQMKGKRRMSKKNEKMSRTNKQLSMISQIFLPQNWSQTHFIVLCDVCPPKVHLQKWLYKPIVNCHFLSRQFRIKSWKPFLYWKLGSSPPKTLNPALTRASCTQLHQSAIAKCNNGHGTGSIRG